MENGQPYCENGIFIWTFLFKLILIFFLDWNNLFTTKCVSCQFAIDPGDRWVEALGNSYHSECFCCSVSALENNPGGKSISVHIPSRSKNGKNFLKILVNFSKSLHQNLVFVSLYPDSTWRPDPRSKIPDSIRKFCAHFSSSPLRSPDLRLLGSWSLGSGLDPRPHLQTGTKRDHWPKEDQTTKKLQTF